MNTASPSRRPVVALLVVGLGASLPPLDLAVNVAFPAITAAFELQTPEIRWVVAAYVVAYASLMLAFGRLGDLVGYRRVFRAGLVLGVVAFALCGLAPDYRLLLAARMVQGVAAALLLSCAPALATSLFEESRRLWVLSAFAGMAAAAGLLAPLLGGASIAALGWSGVFWFRVPLALLALLLLPLLPASQAAAHPAVRSTFDVTGASLLAVGMALLLLAPGLVLSAGVPWPAVASAAAGLAAIGAFVYRQRGLAQPFLPTAVVRDPGLVLLNLSSIAVYLATFAVPLIVPYYFARISGYGPMENGMALTLWPLGTVLGSVLAAPSARRFGRRAVAITGAALVALGQSGIGLWAGPSLQAVVPALLVNGAGIGLFQVVYADSVIAALPLHDRGVAGSLTMLTRTIGVLIGAAALSAALQLGESRQLAAGASAPQAFLAAFQSVFLYSALGFASLFALTGLRRRAWGGGQAGG